MAPGVVRPVVHRCGFGVVPLVGAATILSERKKRAGGFQNGVEALRALRDLFDSDEEMEEFGLYLRQMREEERARYRD